MWSLLLCKAEKLEWDNVWYFLSMFVDIFFVCVCVDQLNQLAALAQTGWYYKDDDTGISNSNNQLFKLMCTKCEMHVLFSYIAESFL